MTRRTIFSLWVVCLVAGFVLLMYDSFYVAPTAPPINHISATMPFFAGVSGQASHSSALFQASSTQVNESSLPILLFFAHPHCPCTRASLREFTSILERSADIPKRVVIIFFHPDSSLTDATATWAQTSSTWQSAHLLGQRFSSLRIVTDTNGRIAQSYHVTNSGHTILARADGTILFQGGITPSRGHEGENAGKHAVLTLLKDPRHTLSSDFIISHTYTFGCSLTDSGVRDMRQ